MKSLDFRFRWNECARDGAASARFESVFGVCHSSVTEGHCVHPPSRRREQPRQLSVRTVAELGWELQQPGESVAKIRSSLVTLAWWEGR